jgi:asparagine synthase (glutamine-hydrolysing)
MCRLSIIDLAGGQQPIRNEDGSVWVVFNGEIYNYRELRRELESKGHVFRSATDTEVLVHMYEEEGDRMVERLRGMFAFALWDGRERRLLLARDRFGIKPLYWGLVGKRLVFASELKAILQLDGVERRIDWRALEHVLSSLSTPPDASIIDGIGKLEPARILTASVGQAPQIRRYWSLAFRPDREHGDEYFIERLRELLTECVDLHMVSDVPVGAFLSGGMDSSSIVAVMSKLQREPVRTYSIGFPEPKYDESADARLVAETFGTRHRELIVEPDVTAMLEDIAWHLDEPFGDSSAIPTYMVSKLAA